MAKQPKPLVNKTIGVLRQIRAEHITPQDIEAVEKECGQGCEAWDCISPAELIAAVSWVLADKITKKDGPMPPPREGTDLIDTLPTPEVIAQRIAVARRERDLLRRLYRLSRDARIAKRGTQ